LRAITSKNFRIRPRTKTEQMAISLEGREATSAMGVAAGCMLRLTGISKAYAGVRVLQGVDLQVGAGEVHALLGENGAGKSTLVKVLFGIVQPDAGQITIEGSGPMTIHGPRHALSLGIGLVSQELSLVPQLEVAENIFLGQSGGLSLVKRRDLRERARAILEPIAPHLPPDARVSSLGMAECQVVEIARTLARGGRIIAFDEPTSSLTPLERDGLFGIIRQLKRQGKGIIYISHRMPEIYEIADRFTVLRDGCVVASDVPSSTSPEKLNTLIAGRKLAEARHRSDQPKSPEMERSVSLRLRSISSGRLHAVELSLYRGEIFALTGQVGSGRTELARCIFGADPRTSGDIEINGRACKLRNPRDAVAAGIALIPEDRRGQALVPRMDIERNIGLANYGRFSRFGILRNVRRRRETERLMHELAIRPRRAGTPVRQLSGGNQQKVVIARWLASDARVFLFDEPTRGIDVGAKSEIHAILRDLAAKGATVLMISSELPEVLTLADRIGVMRDGRLAHTIENTAALSEAKLMKLAEEAQTHE
jgi:ABC-type sugar transport system ATPase subunit